jgi:hypothetical protein
MMHIIWIIRDVLVILFEMHIIYYDSVFAYWMHSNLNTKLFYLSSRLVKLWTIAAETETRSCSTSYAPRAQRMNLKMTAHNIWTTGEGIFEEEPRDEGHTNNDGKGNVLQLTKIGEVYIRPLVIITCINWFVYILMNLSSFSPLDRANLLQAGQYEARPKSCRLA